MLLSQFTSPLIYVLLAALVRRDGQDTEVDAEDLVPGDIVHPRQGAILPADVRLLDVQALQALQVDELPLTGESVPVNKIADALEEAEEHLPPADQKNMAFMGPAVTSVSDKTGMLTQNRMTVRVIVACGQRFDVTGETHQADGAVEQDGQEVDPWERTALRDTPLAGLLCNDAELPEDASGDVDEPAGDPMEVACCMRR